jgi:DNA-binding MltR family transcriptional regulator
MPWPLMNPMHGPVIKEIREQSDRAAAILAVSFLEDRLAALLQAWLVDEPNVVSKMFGGSGPLATFSAKIDMGLLLGILEKSRHRELHLIRDIRNKFAHGLDALTFETPRIRDQCENFSPPTFSEPPYMDAAELEKIKQTDFDQWMVEWISAASSGPDTPRERYLIAVRMNYLNFDLLVELKRRGKLASPPKNPSPDIYEQHPRRRVPFPNQGRDPPSRPHRSPKA